MSRQGLVLDHTEDSIDGGLKWSEAGVNSIDLNGVPGRIRLRLLLEAILSPILSLLRRSKLQLYLLFLAFLLGRSDHRASRHFFQLNVLLGSK